MKTIFFFAALLLSIATQAQTTPTTTSPASTTPAVSIPQPTTPTSGDPQVPPPIGTIDTGSMPTTQQPRQDRVRKRQTVMDGKASPGVENTSGRRPKRSDAKKRSATDSTSTNSTPR